MTTTTVKNYIGSKFFDAQMNILEVLEYSERYKGFLLSENNDINGKHRLIMQDQEIEFYLTNQDKYIESRKNSLERERQEQAKKDLEQYEYNNTYGYTESIKLTPMAKGKLLKVLNTKENYCENGKQLGAMKRKDFLKLMIDQGYTLDHKTDLKHYDRNCELKIKANEYRLITLDNSFYVITKSEYDYGMYLSQL